MERMPMTERGHPPFDPEEEALIRALALKLREMIPVYLEAAALNRESVLRFCEVARMLEELARGAPGRLKEYLETQ
jgi:hypothetical protein